MLKTVVVPNAKVTIELTDDYEVTDFVEPKVPSKPANRFRIINPYYYGEGYAIYDTIRRHTVITISTNNSTLVDNITSVLNKYYDVYKNNLLLGPDEYDGPFIFAWGPNSPVYDLDADETLPDYLNFNKRYIGKLRVEEKRFLLTFTERASQRFALIAYYILNDNLRGRWDD